MVTLRFGKLPPPPIRRRSMTSAARLFELENLLDEVAGHELSKTADQLDALRVRMCRDKLSVDEWNALVGAACYLRVEASRRAAIANQEKING